MLAISPTDLADRLYEAAAAGQLVDPLTDEHPGLTEEDAYRIQEALLARHEANGARRIGAKLGLTSRAKQTEMHVDQPIWGWLTDRMLLDPGQPLELRSLVQARVEPEIAFLLERDLAGSGVTAVEVLNATRAVVPALEILDSRYRDYRFRLADVVADNASAGRFVLGAVSVRPDFDLALVGVVLEKNGELITTAAGAAVLGHPASAVAWLVRRLAQRGGGLRAGEIILSGGLTSVVRVEPGDVVTATFDRLGSISIRCR
jgi:2-oxo-3-hexenedioate decarboxylase